MEADDTAGGPVPILVFGSGQRSGSTLIQRLISSHPDLLVWGEHGGHLREILERSELLGRWDEGLSEPAREQFAEKGHQGWMANLLPEPGVVADAARAYVETLFAAPAAALGCRRWGFKEVRFGLDEAEAIRRLFPGTRVVHITRDPRKMLISLEHWERDQGWWRREFTELAVADWLRVNESFRDVADRADWIRSWRLEDVVEDPAGLIADVADLIQVPPAELDHSVLERQEHGYSQGERRLLSFDELPRQLRGLLRPRELRALAEEYGYDI